MQPSPESSGQMIDLGNFFVALSSLCSERNEEIQNLLRPGVKYAVSKEFTRQMATLTFNLIDRYVQRASLFGQYRIAPLTETDNVRKRKLVDMNVVEQDFVLAWQTLTQDSAN